MTSSKLLSISPTARRKALFVMLTTFIFAYLGFVTTMAAGRPLELGLTNAVVIGFTVGLFEEFYVQSEHGAAVDAADPAVDHDNALNLFFSA